MCTIYIIKTKYFFWFISFLRNFSYLLQQPSRRYNFLLMFKHIYYRKDRGQYCIKHCHVNYINIFKNFFADLDTLFDYKLTLNPYSNVCEYDESVVIIS